MKLISMKKIIIISAIILNLFFITGCDDNKYIDVYSNDGKIIIDTTNITSKATFVNYEVDSVVIQFIVVRGSDGVVRIAFNTCQVCNPSPNAYFIQKGNYLECQNCKTKFSIDKLGIEIGGCNPQPVENKQELENKIILDQEYVETFKEKFVDWNGKIG